MTVTATSLETNHSETSSSYTVPYHTLRRTDLNPRKRFDEAALNELAQSILEHGLLQPLVVRPHPQEKEQYEIVAGERRHRALSWLLEQDEIEKTYPVPVVVRDVSDFELVLLATTENIQREDMTPLEEADAFVQLVELGEDEEGIALRTGVSPSTVKLRLKLAAGLSANSRRALEQEKINLSQAQALLMVSKGLQNELLPRIIEYGYSSKDIKRLVTQGKVPVGRNLFPVERYSQAIGAIITDIFQPEHPGWFANLELFIKLQNEAIEEKLAELKEQYDIVETTDSFYAYRYVEGKGAVLELNPYTYEVTLHEGFVKRPKPKASQRSPNENKPRENRRRNEWEATTLTRAVHVEASKDFRLCLILNIMMLLNVRGFDVKVDPDKTRKRTPANRVFSNELQQAFDEVRGILEGKPDAEEVAASPEESELDKPYLPAVSAYDDNTLSVFETLKAMSDKKLKTLFSQLTAVMIAHGYSDKPWNTEVKQIVASETGLEVGSYLDASDSDYLSLHTKAELGELAEDAGIALDVTAMKKAAAVAYLSESEQVKAYVPERMLLKG